MFYSDCYCKEQRASFHITFAPLSQNITYRPSSFLGHISRLHNDLKRIPGNKELIKCKRTKDVLILSQGQNRDFWFGNPQFRTTVK